MKTIQVLKILSGVILTLSANQLKSQTQKSIKSESRTLFETGDKVKNENFKGTAYLKMLVQMTLKILLR